MIGCAVILTAEAARELTEEVKQDAAALWAKLLKLYEGGAHTALGYASWADYCGAEFDMGKSHAYRVLDAARVVETVPQLGNASESVARELVPVLREDPQHLEEVWGEVLEEHGPEPTAKQVREHVRHPATPGHSVLGMSPDADDALLLREAVVFVVERAKAIDGYLTAGLSLVPLDAADRHALSEGLAIASRVVSQLEEQL